MSEINVLQKFLLLGALFAVLITLLATPLVVGTFRRKVTASMNRAFRNIDPSELYGFLTGGLAREFVKDGDDLAQRLARRDDRQDPDGLYRVT